LRDRLAPHDLVCFGRIRHVVRVLVRDDGEIAVEHGLVECEGGACVAAEVQVRGGCYAHWSLGGELPPNPAGRNVICRPFSLQDKVAIPHSFRREFTLSRAGLDRSCAERAKTEQERPFYGPAFSCLPVLPRIPNARYRARPGLRSLLSPLGS